MHNSRNNFESQQNLTLQSISNHDSSNESSSSSTESSFEWISAFNTSLLTTRVNHLKDRSHDLAELMQSPEFASLIVGAKHLAQTQGISKEQATERMIEVFRKIDFSWKQIVMKRGMQSMIE